MACAIPSVHPCLFAADREEMGDASGSRQRLGGVIVMLHNLYRGHRRRRTLELLRRATGVDDTHT